MEREGACGLAQLTFGSTEVGRLERCSRAGLRFRQAGVASRLDGGRAGRAVLVRRWVFLHALGGIQLGLGAR